MLETLGNNLKRIREEKGYTKTELAKRCGLNRKIIKDIEFGYVTTPTTKTLIKLADGLGITLEDLIK